MNDATIKDVADCRRDDAPLSEAPSPAVGVGQPPVWPQRIARPSGREPLQRVSEQFSAQVNKLRKTAWALEQLAAGPLNPRRDGALLRNIAAAQAEHLARLERIGNRLQASVRRQACYDPLTGLANRQLFLDRLAQVLQAAQASATPAAVVLLDLERFKAVNEMFGRDGGDEVLRQVTERLLCFAGLSNQLARISSNQFAIIVPRVHETAELTRLLDDETWRRLWQQPYACGAQELRLSARLGIALFPADGSDAAVLLANAEAALLKAKAAGGRYLFYTAAMSSAIRETLQLETQLRRALENREFVLHYQPKLDLRSGAVCGAEALIRWQSRERGLVLPQHFVGLLEETGLIVEVGRWALQQAAADHRAWAAAGLPAPPIAVNVSPLQLRQTDFEEQLRTILPASAAMSPLQLEVTESLLMTDVEATIARLERIRALGVSIAIDDFGTGYSSLAYLARLPIAAVKIDRSFVVKMATNANTLSIVHAILSLAHSMNLKIIAEGVDSPEQLRLLRHLRCHEMQGFLFSPAIPAAAFAELLATGRRLEDSDVF